MTWVSVSCSYVAHSCLIPDDRLRNESPMNSLERFHAAMTYQPRDRAPFKEFPWPAWAETIDLWSQQGGYDPQATDFGCDRWVVEFSWFMPHPPFASTIVRRRRRSRDVRRSARDRAPRDEEEPAEHDAAVPSLSGANAGRLPQILAGADATRRGRSARRRLARSGCGAIATATTCW